MELDRVNSCWLVPAMEQKVGVAFEKIKVVNAYVHIDDIE